jgi:hypothetical protein
MAIELLQDINNQVLTEGQWNVVHSEQGECVLYLQVSFVNTTWTLKKLFQLMNYSVNYDKFLWPFM